MVAHTDGRKVTSYETLLDGFLPGSRDSLPGGWEAGRVARGRPADVLQLPDGSVLISDDTGNRILRVSYHR
jgi:glucose/arabinose dehydrogenase